MHKFSKKTIPYIFLGYSSLHKCYRCLDPKSNRVYISRHVVFNEKYFPLLNKEPFSSQNLVITKFPSFDESFLGKSNKNIQAHATPLATVTRSHCDDFEIPPNDPPTLSTIYNSPPESPLSTPNNQSPAYPLHNLTTSSIINNSHVSHHITLSNEPSTANIDPPQCPVRIKRPPTLP